MKKGALEFAQNINSFDLITVGTSSQTEIEHQIDLIDSLIEKKIDAMVVVPIDSRSLVPVVVKAAKVGIKVINIDIRLDEGLLRQNGIELTYVGPDNLTASQTVGSVLAKKLKPGSKVILIEGLKVAENAMQCKQGFLKSITDHQLNLVASEAADWETNKAEEVFRRLYEENPETEGVMCSNDAMAIGVIKVLEEHGKAGKILVVGFDYDASGQPLLKSGSLLATIDAFGSLMAIKGIEYALKVLAGMENRGSYATDFKLITK